MSSKHKGEDYKKSAVKYYLLGDKSQIEVCNIFKCNRPLAGQNDCFQHSSGRINQ